MLILSLYPSQLENEGFICQLEQELTAVLKLIPSSSQEQNYIIDRLILETDSFPIEENIANFTKTEFAILNKHNLNVKNFVLNIGEQIFLENLLIEHKASIKDHHSKYWSLLQVQELNVEDDPKLLFLGWLCVEYLHLNNFSHYKYEIFPVRVFDPVKNIAIVSNVIN